MLKASLALVLIVGTVVSAVPAPTPPPAEAFTVLRETQPPGPRITPYLKYETETAWREDDARRAALASVRDERDLLRLQRELRAKLLEMIGGLPEERTPLRPRVTGRIQMDGFHIEKLVFESLPGVYVTALVYVPDDGRGPHPAVLVPCGHSADGKVHYQALCQRLVQRGYVVICWDPVGQGERSQFWDAAAHRSRYNLICGEHAVLGNLAYLAGANLARWEVWDGMRALDYLLTRPEVDPARVSVTGTSGGGFQTAHLAALDERIKVAAPSCYITALPMRVYNRIFKDPDSDPEQDLYGMIAEGVDHPGLLLLVYPRPVFVAAAVLDFFPIEGTRKTFREVADVYRRFGHADRIAMAEGYHEHQYSPENQEAALDFLDRFNRMPARRGLPPVKELDEQTLRCTRTGQVLLDHPDGRPLLEVIREYYLAHKHRPAHTLGQVYYGARYPGINDWAVAPYAGSDAAPNVIGWEAVGTSEFDGIRIDKYLLHHSGGLRIPLLHMHKVGSARGRVLLWFSARGKADAVDWGEVTKYVAAGYDVVSFDCRGLGETRMPYKATSIDDPALARLDFDQAYVSPISGVLADYVYNSLLVGRPYYLQMIEDAEIAARFARTQFKASDVAVTAGGEAYTLAHDIAEVLPGVRLLPQEGARPLSWSELVEREREQWPIQYLLPGGAYIR
jgi:cephalosporin-C deacetylase-like acetyl esterase